MKPALPPRPVGPGGTGSPGPFGGAPRGRMRAAVPFLLGVLVLLSAFNLLVHHENTYEKLASDVTAAIAANDMRPVEKEFNALRRPQLEDRGKVGRLSDFVNAEGRLKKIKEDTPADAKPGFHHFVAEFEKGTRAEDLTVDADGKIADFHVRESGT